MKNYFTSFTKNQSFIYKILLFVLSTGLIMYLLPKGGQFKYNFQKGKPWQYENLYAPFSFTIKKSDASIEEEKKMIIRITYLILKSIYQKKLLLNRCFYPI